MSDSGRNDDANAVAIHDLLKSLADQRAAGVEIDYDDVIARHAHLGDGLKAAVNAFRSVMAAAQNAKREDTNGQDADDEHQDFGIELLRDHLKNYRDFVRMHAGGQGTVYRAVHQQTGREVAIKMLTHGPFGSATAAARILREADVIARLKHLNIVQLYESGELKGVPYLVLELVDGLEIDDHVSLNDMEPGGIAKIMIQVCEALDYAHKRGVIHRDLKPSNILVDSDGQPHILDFGLAKDLVETGRPTLSIEGQMLGTLSYASPEHIQPENEIVDVRSDVYSIGVILHQLLTGGYPYAVEGSYDEVRQNILHQQPTPLRRKQSTDNFDEPLAAVITRDLESIVLKALAKDKSARYQTAADLAADMRRYLDGDLVQARNASRSYVFRKTLYRHRFAFFGVSFVLLAAVGTSVGFWTLWRMAEFERARTKTIAFQAFGLFQDTFGPVSDELQSLAGGTEVRDRLQHEAETRLEGMRRTFPSGPEWTFLSALSAEESAKISATQGDFAEARDAYDDAIGYWNSVHGDAAQQKAASLALARLYRLRSAASEDRLADLDKSEAILDELWKADPTDADVLTAYRMTMAEIIERLNSQRRFEAAAEKADKVQETESTAPTEDVSADESKLLARLYAARGRAYLETNQEDAVHTIKAAVDLRESIFRNAPADVRNRSALIESLEQLGDVLRGQRKYAEALATYERAYEPCKYLLTAEPSNTLYLSQNYFVLDRLVDVDVQLNALDTAQQYAERAMETADQLRKLDPQDSRWIRISGYANRLMCNVASKQGDLDTARMYCVQALELFRDLARRDPGNVSDRQYLGYTHTFLAMIERKTGHLEASYTHDIAALDIRLALLEEQPTVIERHLEVVESDISLAIWHFEQPTRDHLDSAAELLDDANSRLEAVKKLEIAANDQRRIHAYAKRIASQRDKHDRLLQELERNGDDVSTPVDPGPEATDPSDTATQQEPIEGGS